MTKAVDYYKLVAWLMEARELYKAIDVPEAMIGFINLLLKKLDEFLVEEEEKP
ncbi:MAG: hypothetical protein QXT14_03045 [Candidatus Bathyarchaeia archaeon]